METQIGKALSLVALFALVALAAGCGGSDSDSSSDSTTATSQKPLTKAQYIKRADQVCEEVATELSKQYQAFAKEHGIKNLPNKQQATEIAEMYYVPSVERRIERLRELNPPKADERKIEAILIKTEAALGEAKNNPLPLLNIGGEDPFRAEKQLAERYGFRICGAV